MLKREKEGREENNSFSAAAAALLLLLLLLLYRKTKCVPKCDLIVILFSHLFHRIAFVLSPEEREAE
jgi:LPXTG-motif cell wall-anchored protein